MATESVYLKGKASWIQIQKPNKYGDYTMTLYPDGPSLKKIMDLKQKGILNRLSQDKDGTFMRFKCASQKNINGKMIGFPPPLIMQADGKTPLVGVLVGNGSDVTVKLLAYPYNIPGQNKKGLAVRLAAIRVDNLVPFEMKKDFTEEQTEQIAGLQEVEPVENF